MHEQHNELKPNLRSKDIVGCPEHCLFAEQQQELWFAVFTLPASLGQKYTMSSGWMANAETFGVHGLFGLNVSLDGPQMAWRFSVPSVL